MTAKDRLNALRPSDIIKARLGFPHWLALAFTVYFGVLPIGPIACAVWWADVVPVVLIFRALALSCQNFRCSNTAHALMSV